MEQGLTCIVERLGVNKRDRNQPIRGGLAALIDMDLEVLWYG